MSQSTKPINPLRQRMLEDMALRKMSPHTQRNYIQYVVRFTRFLGRSPSTVVLCCYQASKHAKHNS